MRSRRKPGPKPLPANERRGIASIDARGVVQAPRGTHLATTDFYQAGTTSRFGRMSLTTDVFLIDRSNELVYIADDGS